MMMDNDSNPIHPPYPCKSRHSIAYPTRTYMFSSSPAAGCTKNHGNGKKGDQDVRRDRNCCVLRRASRSVVLIHHSFTKKHDEAGSAAIRIIMS